MESGLGVVGALLFDLAHKPADVLARVPSQVDHLALLHALPYGVGHGDGQRGTCVVSALLGCGLGAHCLPQRSDGLFGGGHVDMFAHRGGHTEVRRSAAHSVLTCGHIHVASWVWRIKRSKHPHLSHPLNLSKDQYMAVSKRLRYEILRRDSHTCRYCGRSAPGVPLRVDHVTPVALGGGDEPTNLATSCEDCNGGKSSASPDATLVADVSDDALRWSAAMAQAAEELRAQTEPKLAYRAAFLQAWNEWTWERDGKREPFGLPDGWKTSLDNFREAGLPFEVWPDAIEKTMTNKTVRSDNLFRYCCGIGWRMVRELQERARGITGQVISKPEPLDLIVTAALKVWTDERGEAGSAEDRARIQETAAAALKREDPHRILEGAQYAAWYGMTGIGDAIAQHDMDYLVQRWTFAWLAKTGEWPDDKRTERVTSQCEALLVSGIDLSRVSQAAVYAGAHRSMRIYFGLSEQELAVTGQSEYLAKAAEAWTAAYQATTARWPSDEEIAAFFDSMQAIGDDGDIWIVDVYSAAAAAGAYQDPDISTCLTRHMSVFEVAARPVGGEN